ncbi:MAG: extracellular solute-binding protein [Ruminococcaceae bacterium]|nr:extracellular solute-binding protein [Oscillospiraceae bacterium]
MKCKNLISLFLCGVTVVGLCSCSGSLASHKQGERSLTHKICDEPLELTLFAREVEDYSEESVWVGAFDKTNVLLRPILSENVTNMDQALALAVAAREIPDVVYDWNRGNFNKYGAQGALIPLNDLIDQYAPNYKKFLEENPDIKYYSTASDGNIYFIPFIPDGEASTGWFIRQDWLDKLDLDAPDNLSEFYDVMVAFKEKDPNGNGLPDEVPYFGARGDLGGLLSLYNARKDFGYSDGKVTFGPMEDNYLQAVTEITKWYKEGLIDNEIFTRIDAKNYFTATNTGGITHDWLGSTAKRNDTLKNEIPGFNFVVFKPPAGIDGVRREERRRNRAAGEGWGISSMNQHPVETIKYFDFWFTEEGRRMANFGLEGIHYDVVDGKPVFKESVLQKDDVSEVMNYIRSYINFGFWQDYAYEEQWMNQIARDGLTMYRDNGYLPKRIERPILSYYDDEEKQTILENRIGAYVDETLQKWVFGMKDPATDYPGFKDRLRELGVEEYIAIEQKAYEKYLAEVAE